MPHIKSPKTCNVCLWACKRCKYHFLPNCYGCSRYCFDNENSCECLEIKCGEVCPYYKRYSLKAFLAEFFGINKRKGRTKNDY